MTHRDRAGDPAGHRAGSREAAGPAEHRQGFPTPSGDKRTRPGRRLAPWLSPAITLADVARLLDRAPVLRCRGIAATGAPSRKPREAVSMGL